MFNVVLVEPEIPPNTGNIGRLCLATRSTLHLVGPLGFSTDDRTLKRAGLDYWADVNVRFWNSFGELQASQDPAARYFFLTTKSSRLYHAVRFERGDFLVFGRETKGLPEALLRANADRLLTIPMHGTRSLNLAITYEAEDVNLATAVAIVLFEAVRQQT